MKGIYIMQDIIKKLSKLSFIEISDNELSAFKNDFSDIIPLIDKISDFPIFEDTSIQQQNYTALRSDKQENHKYKFKTNTVPRLI